MNGGVVPFSLFTEYDIHLFRNGLHYKLYNLLGSHLVVVNGVKGVYFAVWAPSASNVTVMGDFNYWRTSQYRLNPRWDNSGIWEGFVPGVKQGAIYKYNITGPDGKVYEKGDPYAFRWEASRRARVHAAIDMDCGPAPGCSLPRCIRRKYESRTP